MQTKATLRRTELVTRFFFFLHKKRVGSQSTQFVLLLPSHFRQATCKCSRRPHLLRQKLKKYRLVQPRSHLLRVGEPRQQKDYNIIWYLKNPLIWTLYCQYIFCTFLYQKYHNMRFLKNIKKTKKIN